MDKRGVRQAVTPAGKAGAEQAGAAAERVSDLAHPAQGSRSAQRLSGGSSLLHRVLPHPRGGQPLSPAQAARSRSATPQVRLHWSTAMPVHAAAAAVGKVQALVLMLASLPATM